MLEKIKNFEEILYQIPNEKYKILIENLKYIFEYFIYIH